MAISQVQQHILDEEKKARELALLRRPYVTRTMLGLDTTDSPVFAGLTINGNATVTGVGDFQSVARYNMFTYFV